MLKKLTPMLETVDTSINGEVLPHKVSQQSKLYDSVELHKNRTDLQRFNIPWDYANKVGFRWDDEIYVVLEDNKLIFSRFNLEDSIEYPIFFSSIGGDPRSTILDRDTDNVYTLIQSERSPFHIGEEIKFQNLQIKVLKCENSKFDDDPEITAYIQVKDLNISDNEKVFIFNGWTFSSSPTLKPFDHPVYDLWLSSCKSI